MWTLVLDESAFRILLACRASERQKLLSYCESLKGDPYAAPDFDIQDASGRTLSVRAFRPFLITYWLDASIKEVRVVAIERITI